MTPEEKSLLERTCKMVEDNNAILHSIRRTNRLSVIIRVTYWVLILVISFGAYYFIQPYLTMMLGLYSQATGGIHSIQGGMDTVQSATDSIKELLR